MNDPLDLVPWRDTFPLDKYPLPTRVTGWPALVARKLTWWERVKRAVMPRAHDQKWRGPRWT